MGVCVGCGEWTDESIMVDTPIGPACPTDARLINREYVEDKARKDWEEGERG